MSKGEPDDGQACKKCGRMMGVVADIAPGGNDPGLRAFLCDGCGATGSVLVYPTRRIDPPRRRAQPAKPANNNSSLSLSRMRNRPSKFLNMARAWTQAALRVKCASVSIEDGAYGPSRGLRSLVGSASAAFQSVPSSPFANPLLG